MEGTAYAKTLRTHIWRTERRPAHWSREQSRAWYRVGLEKLVSIQMMQGPTVHVKNFVLRAMGRRIKGFKQRNMMRFMF